MEAPDLEKVLEELQDLKKNISPLLMFVNEMRDLKTTQKDAGFLQGLTLKIKDEVLKDVSALNFPLKTSISELHKEIEFNQNEMHNKFDYFQGSLVEFDALTAQTNESIGQVKGHLNKFYDKIDEVRKELEDKSPVSDMNEIKHKIKSFALQNEIDMLKSDLSYKAPKDSIEKLNNYLKNIEKSIAQHVDRNDLDDIKTEIQLKVESYMDLNCLMREDFFSFKDTYLASKLKSDDDFKGLIHKVDAQNQVLKKNLNKLQEELREKPWKKNIAKVKKELATRAKLVDFKDLENAVYPKLNVCKENIETFAKKVSVFEGILLRYDEILLEKASKDDVKLINSMLELLTKKSEFLETKQNFLKQFQSTDSEIQNLLTSVKSIESSIVSLFSRLEHLKKESKEAASVASSLNMIKTGLDEKVDKIDFYQLIDQTGRKEEVEMLIGKFEVFHKQIELITILSQSLCRTMLSNGESSTIIIKQRQDLYKKMGGLLSWVNGEGPRIRSPVPLRGSPLVRPELYLCREDSLKTISKTSRNATTRIKMRPKRYTPRPVFSSFDLPMGAILQPQV